MVNKIIIFLVAIIIGASLGLGVGYLGINPQVNELEESIQERDRQIDELRQERISNRNEIHELKFNINSLNNEVSNLNLEINNNQLELNQLESQISQKEEELNTVNIALNNAKNQINMLNIEIEELKINEKLNKEEIERLEELKASLEMNTTVLELEKEALRNSISDLRKRYDEVKELWDLWESNRDIGPSNNEGYRFEGDICFVFCTYVGNAIVIPFPNLYNCFSWNKFASTGSMRPFIHTDNIGIGVKAECLNSSDIKQGDMIAFDGDRLWRRDLEWPVSHQVIEVVSCSHDRAKTCYITKGTNNDFIDGEVRFEEIVEKIIIINF
tara:strand:- start:22 stop:1005 length:984 start_codon:yes stop_codon:yes gene_type:complete